MELETYYYDCQCLLIEDTLRFVLDPEDGDLWTEIYYAQYKSFWKRLWYGIKYILGNHVEYRNYGCWLLNPKDCESIIILLQRAKDLQEKELKNGIRT